MAEFKNTSFSEGFGIFNKVSETEFDVVNQNRLRLFMLNTENKLFNYDELYQYILSNITRYVFDRRKSTEIENMPHLMQSAILEILHPMMIKALGANWAKYCYTCFWSKIWALLNYLARWN